jgi:hypothetical protein
VTKVVCAKCSGINVMRDAWVNVNDPGDVRTFDDTYCLDCEESCRVVEREDADDQPAEAVARVEAAERRYNCALPMQIDIAKDQP